MSERDEPDGAEDDGRPITRRSAVRRLGAAGAGAALSGLGWGAGAGDGSAEALGAPEVVGTRRAPDPPNVLFVMTDDHAARALGAYGGRLLDTPNLDRLAREGALFENCFVTNSICCPSRATMLTGTYSHRHGVYENLFGDKEPFDGSQPAYPALLRDAGYRTALVGKWHLKSEPTGFDHWNVLPWQGRYRNPRFVEKGDVGPGDATVREGEKTVHEGYATDVITDLSIRTLEQRLEGDRPFCLLCHHKAPHRRWVPEEDKRGLFTGQDLPVPATFHDDWHNRAPAARHAEMRVANMPDWEEEQPAGMGPAERKHWNYQRFIKQYLRTVASVDESVGRLLEYLDRTGRAEDTIVVYTTDNGFFLGEHGWYDKRFMYEESIRIPLLVRYPRGVEPGTVVRESALNLDFARTFLDYAGVEPPARMQGRSLRPLLEGRGEGSAGSGGSGSEGRPGTSPGWRDGWYYHYYEYPGPHRVRPHYGVRTDRHKLIYYYTVDQWELFDLRQDPHELNSVHGAPAYAEVRRRMTDRLRELRRRVGDDTGPEVPE
ncbi:MAG: sulfatase [Gemmatimonadota bacterium]